MLGLWLGKGVVVVLFFFVGSGCAHGDLPRQHILGEGQVGLTIDGDVVVVVPGQQRWQQGDARQ